MLVSVLSLVEAQTSKTAEKILEEMNISNRNTQHFKEDDRDFKKIRLY